MKFGHLIKVHAVPAWQSQYLAYHELKKILYAVEKERRDSEATLHIDEAERYSQLEHQQQIPPGMTVCIDVYCTVSSISSHL